ncbi:MAG: hypothetical protein KAJ58_01480 [Candidatus Pacebacteria bacterium]|nr:hypothetical protein [Candidatus Paceibacterota bacterium]
MKYISFVFKITLVTLLLACTGSVFALDSSSSSYIMERAELDSGGGLSTSANYELEDTAGIINSGEITGTSYSIDVGYQQAVIPEEEDSGSCNNDGVCQSGETNATCPSDCQLGGTIPTLIGTIGKWIGGFLGGAVNIEPERIYIKNIKVVSTDEGEIKVTWQTNRVTLSEFILSDEGGEERFRHAEFMYRNLHQMLIPGLDLTKKYYFRILSSDEEGLTNYDYSDLYTIKPLNLNLINEVGGDMEFTGVYHPEITYKVEIKNEEKDKGNIIVPVSECVQSASVEKRSRLWQILDRAKETLINFLRKLF